MLYRRSTECVCTTFQAEIITEGVSKDKVALTFGNIIPDKIKVEDTDVLSLLKRIRFVRKVVIAEFPLNIVWISTQLNTGKVAVKFEGVVTDCGEASCQTDQTTVFANDLVLDHQVVAEIERNKRHLRIKIDQTT